MSLEAKNLTFSYPGGVQVLKDLSVSVPKGKITALIGRNGCGKSTLLKLLNRLLQAQSGEITLNGRSLADFPAQELAKTLAHLAQSPEAPEGLRVRGIGRIRPPSLQELLGTRNG